MDSKHRRYNESFPKLVSDYEIDMMRAQLPSDATIVMKKLLYELRSKDMDVDKVKHLEKDMSDYLDTATSLKGKLLDQLNYLKDHLSFIKQVRMDQYYLDRIEHENRREETEEIIGFPLEDVQKQDVVLEEVPEKLEDTVSIVVEEDVISEKEAYLVEDVPVIEEPSSFEPAQIDLEKETVQYEGAPILEELAVDLEEAGLPEIEEAMEDGVDIPIEEPPIEEAPVAKEKPDDEEDDKLALDQFEERQQRVKDFIQKDQMKESKISIQEGVEFDANPEEDEF